MLLEDFGGIDYTKPFSAPKKAPKFLKLGLCVRILKPKSIECIML